MPFYRTADQFYDCLQLTFNRVTAQDPQSLRSIQRLKLTARIQTNDPDAQIHLDGHKNPVKITLGPSTHRAELIISGSTDTLHEVLLGTLGIRDSMASRRLIVNGPIFKALALVDFFHGGQKIYPGVLREKGFVL